jgi:hypothetical protein
MVALIRRAEISLGYNMRADKGRDLARKADAKQIFRAYALVSDATDTLIGGIARRGHVSNFMRYRSNLVRREEMPNIVKQSCDDGLVICIARLGEICSLQ